MRNYHKLALLFLLVSITITRNSLADAMPQYWQLTLKYDQNTLQIIDAEPFDAPRKQVHTPGLDGAAVKLNCNLDWLGDSGKSIGQTNTTLPIGWRSCLDPKQAPEAYIPDSDIIVVRVKGPMPKSGASNLRLSRSTITRSIAVGSEIPSPLAFTDVTLPLPQSSPSKGNVDRAPAGPISKAKIHDTGPDSNRLVLVVMGDGFTADDLADGSFVADAQILQAQFTNKSPYDIYYNATNVYRVDIQSSESGSDEPLPGPGTYKNTYLNSSFWTGGTERLLALDATGHARAVNAANAMVGPGLWDDIFVIVNSTRYGGSGGTIAVSSVNYQMGEIIMHEFGHTFAGLADEYESGGSGLPTDDHEPNVDYQSSRSSLKWAEWVDTGTPLPTPFTSQYEDSVGAFTGAKYWPTGIYRPYLDCIMRTLGRPFCPVCKEAIVLSYAKLLKLADSQSPAPTQVIPINEGGTDFSVNAIPVAPMTYQWSLNGNPIPTAAGPTYHLYPASIPLGNSTLTVTIHHPTLLVRKQQIAGAYSWTLNRNTRADAENWELYK